MYLHDTTIAHTRRALDGKFAPNQVHETLARFKIRMKRISEQLNSPDFAARAMELLGLAKELRPRCEAIIKALGERLSKYRVQCLTSLQACTNSSQAAHKHNARIYYKNVSQKVTRKMCVLMVPYYGPH